MQCNATEQSEYLQSNTNGPMRVHSASLHNQVSLGQAKAKAKIAHLSFEFSNKHCANNKTVCTKDSRVEDKLNEEFERRLGDHTSNPRTKMVHLADTSVHLTTVMRPICLELTTRRTVRRSPIYLTDEKVLGVEALQPRRIQRICFPSSIRLQSPFDIDIRVRSISLLGCFRSRPTTFPSMMFATRTI